MSCTYSVAAGQRDFPRLIKRAEAGELAVVTRHDKTVAYVVSAERMDGLLETLELLADPEFRTALQSERKGRTKYKAVEAAFADQG